MRHQTIKRTHRCEPFEAHLLDGVASKYQLSRNETLTAGIYALKLLLTDDSAADVLSALEPYRQQAQRTYKRRAAK